MNGILDDGRIYVIAGISAVVIAGSYWLWRHEIRRLHRERGYDAHDPLLNHEAWQNTRSKLRTGTERGRNALEIVRALILAPAAALIAVAFTWAALPSQYNPTLRWDMLGVAAVAAIAGWFMGRILVTEWRAFRDRRR